jgi:hypothetical protein
MNELQSNGVQIYHFPTDDQTVADTNNAMNVSLKTFTLLELIVISLSRQYRDRPA